jgi:hypothetical protein
MKISYDTDLDSISSPDLSPQQTRELQSMLVSALANNEPVRDVAAKLMAAAKKLAAG